MDKQSAAPVGIDELPSTLIEAAYRRLHEDILGGRLAPGEKLRVEHLKAVYQVSSGTLREALTRLVADSLVVFHGQRGFRVAAMSLDDLKDLTRLRVMLETTAIRESIASGGALWEAQLRSAFNRLARAEQGKQPKLIHDFDTWESCNRQFHEALVGACQSPWILRLRGLLYGQAERYRRLSATTIPQRPDAHDEHRAIFEAALVRNADVACALSTAHIHRALTIATRARILR